VCAGVEIGLDAVYAALALVHSVRYGGTVMISAVTSLL
jgi:hypothetical protein